MGWSERIVVNDGKPADTPMRIVVEFVGEAAPPQKIECRPAWACRTPCARTCNWSVRPGQGDELTIFPACPLPLRGKPFPPYPSGRRRPQAAAGSSRIAQAGSRLTRPCPMLQRRRDHGNLALMWG